MYKQKLKLFKQSRGYCGPACLKMVLSRFGMNKSENYLAKITKTSRLKGCGQENIVKAAKKLGFKGYVKQKSSIKEVKQLVKKGNSAELVEKLNFLLNDNEKSKSMGELGRKFIEDKFSWEKVAKEFITIVERKL